MKISIVAINILEYMREEYEMLNFRGGNPGAVQYGNFINYYQFNLPKNRLELLPTNIWNVKDQFFGLDVGCNSGVNLTGSDFNLENKIIFRILLYSSYKFYRTQ